MNEHFVHELSSLITPGGHTAARTTPRNAPMTSETSSPFTRDEPDYLDIEPIDPAPWITLLHDRFGMDEEALRAYIWHQPNSQLISLLTRSHQPPSRPAPISMGLPFIRTTLRFPKMTTGGTLLVGPLATRHVIDLDEPQLNAYYSRQTYIALRPEQTICCESMGYVIVKFEGIVLGQGFYRPASTQGEEPANFDSFYPKAFANHAQRSALG